MATSTKAVDGIQVVVAAAGTVVAAAPQPYENTHTIVVYNTTAAVDGYVNWQTGSAAMAATGAVVVPGGGSITLSIGAKSGRVPAGTDTLQFDGSAPCTFQVTYVNGRTL